MPVTITRVNDYTFLTETFVEVTTWWNGTLITPANEATILGALYFKDTDPMSPHFEKYFKLAFTGAVPLSRWDITQAIFTRLVADLGAGGTIYVDRQIVFETTWNIPANVALQFPATGAAANPPGFYVNANVTLGIPSTIIAGNDQIFFGPGSIKSVVTYTASLNWFGVIGDGVADDTAAFQRYINYCRISTGGDLVYIKDGRYKVGTLDFTGCKRVIGETINTTLAGKPGLDVCYWKSTGEAGYVALTDVELKSLRIVLETSIEMPDKPLRLGFGGELVGNCAIFMPGGFTYNFDQIWVTTSHPNNRYGSCGFFSDGQAYKMNWGTKCEFRSIDYGIIVGVSEKANPVTTIVPSKVTSFDALTGTFTMNNTYAANAQIALIWDNGFGDITGFMPRERYYVVNPTVTTFQLALAASGPAQTFTVTGTPTLYTIKAGADSIEFACDEWAGLHLITATNKCGISVPNFQQCHFGTFGCQSGRVAARILSYRSKTRSQSSNTSFRELYTEGPLDTVFMSGKEYMRFEGEFIEIGIPLRVYNNSIVNIYASKSTFNGIIFNASAGNKIYIYGNNNHIPNVGAYTKEDQVIDLGTGNKVEFSKSPGGGDSPRFQNYLSRNTFSKDLGGFYPDYLLGGKPAEPYLGEGILFHPAISALLTASGGTLQPIFDNSLMGMNGYIRMPVEGQINLASPLGSNKNKLKVGEFFPRGKWKLYAMVRSLTAAQDLTLFNTTTLGSGGDYTTTVNVPTTWTAISLDLDHSTASTNFTIQISVKSPEDGTGFDLGYFVVAPQVAFGLGGSATLDFPSTAAGAFSDLTIPVAGATAGSPVILGVSSAAVLPLGIYSAWVSAAGVVTVRFNNASAIVQDPASATFNVRVLN